MIIVSAPVTAVGTVFFVMNPMDILNRCEAKDNYFKKFNYLM